MAKQEYKFALANGGWWLIVSNINELLDYNELTIHKYGNVLVNPNENEYSKKLNDLAEIYAENNDEGLVFGLATIARKSFEGKIKCINIWGKVYINCVGGYNGSIKPERIINRRTLVFPNFTKEDIRISQWDKGKGFHYYAYVGDIEVQAGDQIKWNTYDEAYREALKYVTM